MTILLALDCSRLGRTTAGIRHCAELIVLKRCSGDVKTRCV